MIKQQLELLKNTHFSVLLVDRTTEKKAFNYNIKNRTALTVEEVLSAAKTLHYYNNVRKHDIYIKAEVGNFYNVVVDDLTEEKINQLLQVASPTLVIFSSFDNYQVIFNLEKSSYSKSQADFLTKKLNEKYGDPNFSGANHYFRLVGFHNKKQKNNNEKVELVEFQTEKDKNQDKNSEFFAEMLKDFVEQKQITQEQDNINFVELTEEQQKQIRREVLAEIALCKKFFTQLDMSAVDFRIVKRLAKKGYTKEQIATSLDLFTDYKSRHSDPEDYLNRTINNAFNSL